MGAPKKHWYDKCADIVIAYRKLPNNKNEAYEVINRICGVLEEHGFIDSDWWAENEKMR